MFIVNYFSHHITKIIRENLPIYTAHEDVCGLKQKLHFKNSYTTHTSSSTVPSASGNLNTYMECFELLSSFYIHENPDQLKGFKTCFIGRSVYYMYNKK